MVQQLKENVEKFDQHVGNVVSDTGRLLEAMDLDRVQQTAVGRARSAAKATDTFVHDCPWISAGLAAGIGAVIGLLIRRD